MPGSAILSDFLGYTSIACWLCAQFPQVLENVRLQSCEGLALPFLANWFLGDFSNLIGCILTHQLPFQRYLATYFVFVDTTLLIQYIYYQRSSKSPTLPPTASGIPTSPRLSVDRTATRYRTLSAVAANVAAAAALAAQQGESLAHHNDCRQDDRLVLASHTTADHQNHDAIDSDPEEDSLAAMNDSLYSEGGRNIAGKRVSWSIERHRTRAGSASRISAMAPPLVFPTGLDLGSVRRGRSLGRSAEDFLESPEEEVIEPVSPSLTAANRRNSRAGKKSASMVFLGAWALFGVGTLLGSKRGLPDKGTFKVGRVLTPFDMGGSMGREAPIPTPATTVLTTEPSIIPDVIREIPLTFEDQDPPPTEPVILPHGSNPSPERILGRIFAWLCTTLYLTSRLPQIWKNFVRKSVEGLSVYLFVFAFLGNVFYVASIFSSPNTSLPPPQSTEFLKESIPYILGSGGTLMFDVTIVTQFFIYRPKHKRRSTRSRSNTANLEVGGDVTATESERSGLLAGDALAKRRRRHQHEQQQSARLQSATKAPESADSAWDDDMKRGRTTHVTRSRSD